MSANDKTFIDAYGLELNDELAANYGEPARRPVAPARESVSVHEPQQRARTYRFDAAAQRQTLRGPHFDMRRIAAEPEATTDNTDLFDMNVIDVGAAWIPTPQTVEAVAGEATSDALPVQESTQPLAERPEIEKTIEIAPQASESFLTEPSFNFVPDTAERAQTEIQVPAATVAIKSQPITTSPAPVEQPVLEQKSVEQPAREQAPARDEITEEPTVETPAATDAIASEPAPAEVSAEFTPVWEVDRFQWPDEIEQLFKTQAEYFDYAGKKLVLASREGLQILAVTATRSGEGSTTLALCLARAAAGAGARVGLLDGNLVRSELGEKLGVEFASGWQAAAAGDESLGEAAITGLEEGITLFPSASEPVAGVSSLADARVGGVIKAAAASYDLLIIDAGTSDLGNNIELLDAAMVVRDVRLTSEEETLTVASALRQSGVKAVGVAENFGQLQASRVAA